jgi:hypothetical protein
MIVSAELAAIRTAVDRDAGRVNLPVNGALVSGVKPASLNATALANNRFIVDFKSRNRATMAMSCTSLPVGFIL